MEEGHGIFWRGKTITGIIFDVDGTLTDSIETYYQVFDLATREFGLNIRREDVLEPMATGNLIWDHAIPEDLPNREETIKKISKSIVEIFPKEFAKVLPFSGVGQVFEGLEARAVKIGTVTSSWKSVFEPLHEAALTNYIDVFISREDGFPLKPAPDGIIECMRRLEVQPNNTIVVGDTTMDIEAGQLAGTATIGVLSGLADKIQLEEAKPDTIVSSIGDLCNLFNIKTD